VSSTDVAVRDEATEAVLAAQAAEFNTTDLHVPILKVAQALTREVSNGSAVAGEFVNTLTGEGVGSNLGLIVAFYSKGRAGSEGPGERYYTSQDFEIIPPHWGDWLGEQFVGTRFDEHPDAEEMFKERVNAKEIEWGRGPKISTTHNYTGYAIVPGVVDEDGEAQPDEVSPVRLSLKRTDMESVRRINSMFQMKMRNQPIWSRVLDLSTVEKTGKGAKYYGVGVKLGRVTTPEEREMALDLAVAVSQGRVTDNDAAEAKVAPAAKGGLDV
jgi:hypothetical protein